MKLEELYIRLRQHYPDVTNEEQVTVNLQDLADLLFYTIRNVRVVIKKMDLLGWITWVPGRGRGKSSLLTFHRSLDDAKFELFKLMILEGRESEAFIRVEKEASSIQMDLSNWYYQSKFIVTYNESINRIYVRLRELITKENVHVYISMMKENLEKTRPGYTILYDMTDEHVNTPDVEEDMKELRSFTSAKEIKAIVTVVSSPMIKSFVEPVLNEIGLNKIFFNKKEAEEYLNTL